MIKRYKSFLESKGEDVGQGLLEYFLDLEDDFLVDVGVSHTSKGFLSVGIKTLRGFRIEDLNGLFVKLDGLVKKIGSIGEFSTFVFQEYGSTYHPQGTLRGSPIYRPPNGKWGSIEGNGRVWRYFNESDISDSEFISKLVKDWDFKFFYSREARPISIWMDFIHCDQNI